MSLTREVIYCFPAESAIQHQVKVGMRNRGEIRLGHCMGCYVPGGYHNKSDGVGI